MRLFSAAAMACICDLPLIFSTISSAHAAEKMAKQKPNIIFILSDDLGYGDVGCYGQKRIKTPVLDKMASEGIRFTQAYAGSAVCAPSRTSLMTGLTTGHTPIRNNSGVYLEPRVQTVADVLKDAGYHTALIGKWGLSKKNGDGAPEQNGFDESLAYLTHSQAHDYTPSSLWKNGKFISVTTGTYAPDLFTSAALEFVDRKDAKPFFLYLAYTFPHANNELAKITGNGMEIPSDSPYSKEDWPQTEKNKAAMITYMDTEIGMLLDKLREKGLEDNTIIFFSSDNGPHHEGGVKPEFFDSSGPMKGVKRDLYEGGIRMPTIVRWPSKINGGQVSDAPWAFWDFLPTAAELAGGSAKGKLDGRSIVPLLLGKSKSVHDYFYWELEDHSSLSSYRGFQQAVLMGKWKAVHRGNGTELYDLSKDIGEANNIAAENPKIVAKAEELFKSARTEHKYPAGKSKHKSPKSNSKATTSPGGQANGNVETTATR